jgi:fluoride exporter
MEYLVVFVGGGIGAVARFAMSTAIQRAIGTGFPWGTFAVNMLGCFLVGVIAELIRVRVDWQGNVRLFLMVGILGGFTTFSAYGWETLALMQSGKYMAALSNAVGQVAVGVFFVAAGFYLTHHFTSQ